MKTNRILLLAGLAVIVVLLFVFRLGLTAPSQQLTETRLQPGGEQSPSEELPKQVDADPRPPENATVAPAERAERVKTDDLDRLIEVKAFKLTAQLSRSGHPREAQDIARFLAEAYIDFLHQLPRYSSRLEHDGVATILILVPPEQVARFETELRNAIVTEFGAIPLTDEMWESLAGDFLHLGKFPMALTVTPVTQSPTAPLPYYQWTLTFHDRDEPETPRATIGGFALAPGIGSLFGDLVSPDML